MSDALVQSLNSAERRTTFDNLPDDSYEILRSQVMLCRKEQRQWESTLLSVRSYGNGDVYAFFLPNRYSQILTRERVQDINTGMFKLRMDKRGSHITWAKA
jgi:hypothetical protein